MINLDQEAFEFLQIFKIYKIVRLLADVFGEIFIDWQVKETVCVSFADHQIKPLSVLRYMKMEPLFKETVQSFSLSAQFDVPESL